VVRDSLLDCHWESADRRFKIAQIVLPQSKMKKYWESSMEDFQDIWMSTKPWIKFQEAEQQATCKEQCRRVDANYVISVW
jgi:hypothetical protein